MYVYEDLGWSRICHQLDAMGIRPRKGGRWSPATIRTILENPVYIGKIRYNRRKTVRHYHDGEITKSRPASPEETWILVNGRHPALISEALYRAAQEKCGRLPRTKCRKELRNPFAGLCRCTCGAAMVLRTGKHARRRLLCTKQTNCGQKSVTYAAFQDAVKEALQKAVPVLETEYRHEEHASAKLQAETAAHLQRELERIKAQQEKLYDLLERGVYPEDVFVQRSIELKERRKAAEESLRQNQQKENRRIQNHRLCLQEALECVGQEEIPAEAENAFLRSVTEKILYSRSRGEQGVFHLEITLRI